MFYLRQNQTLRQLCVPILGSLEYSELELHTEEEKEELEEAIARDMLVICHVTPQPVWHWTRLAAAGRAVLSESHRWLTDQMARKI